MQSLLEMLEATAKYIEQQAAINAAELKEKSIRSKSIVRVSAAERKARKARKASLNQSLCSKCQLREKYKTKNGVAYGSLCYQCISDQRIGRQAKKEKSSVKDSIITDSSDIGMESACY